MRRGLNRLTSPQDNSSRPAHQAGVLAVGRILSTLAESILPLIIVRLLGKADVGILTALLLINTTLTMVFTMGLPDTLSYHLPARTKGERRSIVRRMGFLLLGFGVLVAAIQLLIAGLSDGDILRTELELVFLAALIGLPLGDLPMRMLPNMLIVEGYERAAASTSIIRSLGLSLGTLIPLAMGASVWTVMIVLSGVGLLFGVVTMAFYFVVYRKTESISTSMSSGSLIQFAVPMGLSGLISNINNRFDRFLIIPLGAFAVADYNLGSWQVPIVPSIAYAVGVSYAPHFAELFKAGRLKEVICVWREQATKTALLVVPISLVFVVAAEEIVTILFGAEYIRAAVILRFYALLSMGRITAFGSILVAAGKPGYVMRAAAIAFFSNVLISVPLYFWIGFSGPALGTMLAFIPMVLGYAWYIGKATGVQFTRIYPLVAWLRVVAVAVPGVIAALAFKYYVATSALTGIVVEGLLVLVGFSLVGTLAGLISRKDWKFLSRYVLLKLGRPVDEGPGNR
jgi:O-antigen/teichoic acid export membrane protein